MKKIVAASALALTLSVGLATSSKAQASSSAKVYFKQYKETKKFAHNSTATFSYQLPQLKGNSAAVKKINGALQKEYKKALASKKNLYATTKRDSNDKLDLSAKKYHDITSTTITYNKNNILSIKSYQRLKTNPDDYTFIGGWNYSLKSGRSLSVFDVAKGGHYVVNKKLTYKLIELGADKYYLKDLPPAKTPFYLFKGKVYAYGVGFKVGYRNPIIFPARYK